MTPGPALADGLELVETDDGIVVYQDERERVHHLNQTAAVILQWCDGTRSVEEIAGLVADLFALDHPPVDDTRACVERLRTEGLVR